MRFTLTPDATPRLSSSTRWSDVRNRLNATTRKAPPFACPVRLKEKHADVMATRK